MATDQVTSRFVGEYEDPAPSYILRHPIHITSRGTIVGLIIEYSVANGPSHCTGPVISLIENRLISGSELLSFLIPGATANSAGKHYHRSLECGCVVAVRHRCPASLQLLGYISDLMHQLRYIHCLKCPRWDMESPPDKLLLILGLLPRACLEGPVSWKVLRPFRNGWWDPTRLRSPQKEPSYNNVYRWRPEPCHSSALKWIRRFEDPRA